MQRRVAMLSARLEASRAIAAALDPLYAALAEPQRRTADELLGAHPLGMRLRGS
ncbi:MAG: Spy/CpxP family protein refolding chaperone [Alphaproteobacteria bacterium]|nr:Spy/CpxP family protein refolding chaperone [Alphaproteobacteria bacterium]